MASSWAALGPHPGYFTDGLAAADPEVHGAIVGELRRQQDQIELIASENVVSLASLGALGSVMTNKTVEGTPGRRYYGGAEFGPSRDPGHRARAAVWLRFRQRQPHSGSGQRRSIWPSSSPATPSWPWPSMPADT